MGDYFRLAFSGANALVIVALELVTGRVGQAFLYALLLGLMLLAQARRRAKPE